MIALEGTTDRHQPAGTKRSGFDMEALVGYILLIGVLLSMALIAIGIVWSWLVTGQLGITYSIAGMNLYVFVLTDIRQMLSGDFQPHLFISMGIATLMLTPYLRVFASMLYFAFVERNRKYTFFTALVFSVLTYSLFLR
ncbi:MAG: DUF1634 domain-containing protein [Deltaproteobacteria bacterium]|nr:DUF1634 domain-containing protein [Deltaproteobacteria bacterium]